MSPLCSTPVCLFSEDMESVTLEEQQQSTTTADRLAKKTKISFPTELIDEILSRLPVKSILRFRSICKPWLSRFSEPSFINLHLTRATVSNRTALFISAYDFSIIKRCFLSAARDGGSVTLLTPNLTYDDNFTDAQQSNGLVFLTSRYYHRSFNYLYLFVVNPSTNKIFQLPQASLMNCGYRCVNLYLFGFDESSNEHKILNIRVHHVSSHEPTICKAEIMIFCMSSYNSWRKIDAELPTGFSWNDLLACDPGQGVCVNSVLHVVLIGRFYDILAFDLRTNKFSIIRTPEGVVPHEPTTTEFTRNNPEIIEIYGRIGVVCHDRVVESNEMHIWILQDYENHVWVREIIAFPKPWNELDFPYPSDAVSMDEIIFTSRKVSENVTSVPIYNLKSRCFKLLQFTLDHQLLRSKTLRFNQIKLYVESLWPL